MKKRKWAGFVFHMWVHNKKTTVIEQVLMRWIQNMYNLSYCSSCALVFSSCGLLVWSLYDVASGVVVWGTCHVTLGSHVWVQPMAFKGFETSATFLCEWICICTKLAAVRLYWYLFVIRRTIYTFSVSNCIVKHIGLIISCHKLKIWREVLDWSAYHTAPHIRLNISVAIHPRLSI